MEINAIGGKSTEELDQIRRSTKKYKRVGDNFSAENQRAPREEAWMFEEYPNEQGERRLTFREMLLKNKGDIVEQEFFVDQEDIEDSDAEEENPGSGIMIEGEESDCANFFLSDRERARLGRPWRKTLIVKLLGKKISHGVMRKKLSTLWGKKGQVSVADVGNDYFSIRFDCLEDMDFVLKGGPWIIFDHYLTIQRWEPNFDPYQANISKVAVWVRLPDLAMEFFDRSFLIKVGSWIGRVLKIDLTTATLARGRYARLCVEINLNQPLKSKYKVEGCLKKIEYEGLGLICFACGRYGHYKEGCPSYLQPVSEEGLKENPQQDKRSAIVNLDDQFGPWMVVNRQRRWRRSAGQEHVAVDVNQKIVQDTLQRARDDGLGEASRFDLLQDKSEEIQKQDLIQGLDEETTTNKAKEKAVQSFQRNAQKSRQWRTDKTWEKSEETNQHMALKSNHEVGLNREVLKEKVRQALNRSTSGNMGSADKAQREKVNDDSRGSLGSRELAGSGSIKSQLEGSSSASAQPLMNSVLPKPPDPAANRDSEQGQELMDVVPETPFVGVKTQVQEGEMEVDPPQ